MRRQLLLLAAALLSAAALLAAGRPAALAASPPSDAQILLQPDGRTLVFRGEITYGSAQTLLQTVRGNPAVKVLVLESIGGYIKPALQIATALQLRGATTYVETHCLSACTMLFLAGKKRVIAPDATLGFHRAWREEKDEKKLSHDTQATNAVLLDRLLQRGVDDDFAERVLATPGTDMWYPTQQELLENGVITAVLRTGEKP